VEITRANAALLNLHFESWLDAVDSWRPFLAIVRGGAAVSVCSSSRLTAAAAEAGLETAVEWRRRGLGLAAVTAWAAAVEASGRVALYSTSWQNTASQGVARRLGAVQYGVNLALW
jgi:hypothetical protein